MLSSKESTNNNHHTNDPLKIYKRLMIASEFIMSSDLEDRYVNFLKEMVNEINWSEFKDEILEEIGIYEITQDEIHQEMNNFIKTKLLVC